MKVEPSFNFGMIETLHGWKMPTASDKIATAVKGESDKTPRTERGRRTLRAILDAATAEFAEKGFHEGSISGITQRAGVALGSFYTYFDSKDEVFKALVKDMSGRLRDHVTPKIQKAGDGLDAERIGLESFLEFVRDNQEIYRIIDEAEFVDYDAYRAHYTTTVDRIRQRLEAAAARGEIRADAGEIHAWAIAGMNVFLGLRYGLWDEQTKPKEIAAIANDLLRRGLAP